MVRVMQMTFNFLAQKTEAQWFVVRALATGSDGLSWALATGRGGLSLFCWTQWLPFPPTWGTVINVCREVSKAESRERQEVEIFLNQYEYLVENEQVRGMLFHRITEQWPCVPPGRRGRIWSVSPHRSSGPSLLEAVVQEHGLWVLVLAIPLSSSVDFSETQFLHP